VKIPTTFDLGGTSWSVGEQDYLPGALGTTDNQKASIALLKNLPKQAKEQTFCHELVHAILFAMGKPGAEHGEEFVDCFATFLHQYFKTAK
jgi:SprT-like family